MIRIRILSIFLAATEENWDIDDPLIENLFNATEPQNPLTINISDLDYPNFEQLSVQPLNEEVTGEATQVSKLISEDEDLPARGTIT